MSTREQAAAALRSADPGGRWSLAELARRADADMFARDALTEWEAYLASLYARRDGSEAAA